MPFAASMADHARAIGDKCFKEEQFVAAVHCYEVATLLCPSGSPNISKLPGPSAEIFGHLGKFGYGEKFESAKVS